MGLNDDLDGYTRDNVYEDDTVVRVSVHRTESSAYPSDGGTPSITEGLGDNHDTETEHARGHDRRRRNLRRRIERSPAYGEGEPVDEPSVLSFADEEQLAEVFNGRSYRLLRIIREEEPESIRATARLVERDVKNVPSGTHEARSTRRHSARRRRTLEEARLPVRRPTDTSFRR